MRIAYEQKSFRRATLGMIEAANAIISEYQIDGFNLTLRQLYYQFVARGLLANSIANYHKLGRTITDARMTGLIDWEAITDRTRNLQSNSHWTGPQQILTAAAESYRRNLWANQPCMVEVWIEKDALIGVIENTCSDFDVPFYACRGYVSASEMWAAGQRILRRMSWHGQETVILHLGDHDPSGLDMTRDILQRLGVFVSHRPIVQVQRIALNRDQIDAMNPPPNPAKETDTRFTDYRREHGEKCWELDAIEPRALNKLIQGQVSQYIDAKIMEHQRQLQEEERHRLRQIAEEA